MLREASIGADERLLGPVRDGVDALVQRADLQLGGDLDAHDGDVDEEEKEQKCAPFDAEDESQVQGEDADSVDDDLHKCVNLYRP